MSSSPKERRELDRDLARAAARQDPQARQRLARRLLQRVRTTVYYLAAGDRDVDDLVQLALMEVLRATPSFRGESSLETFADRIVVRVALRSLQQRRKRDRVVVLDERAEGRTASPERLILQRELQRRLAGLLDRLSPPRRTAVVLHWVHGYTVDEIAGMTATPRDTVRNRLRAGKKRLKKLLQREPYFLEWTGGIDADIDTRQGDLLDA
jgi:RNA polymerase sigma-70 factor (ECF subfamily)